MNQTNTTIKPTAIGGGCKFKNDIIFIAAILAVISVAALAMFLFRREGNAVSVEVNKRVVGTYSLAVDRVVDIPTGEGESNRLIIRDGKAFMETATCPDGICVSHRPVSHVGESIVCLPHQVVVKVIGEGGGEEPDIIA